MESDDGSKIFPNKLRFEDGTISEQDDKTGYYNKLTTSIGQVTIPRNDRGRFYNLCFPLDGNFNGVPLKFTIDTNYLTYQLRLNTGESTISKFEAGKIYTFNFSLEEKAVRLNTIDISKCTTYNVDNTESIEIIVSPNVIWEQTGINSSQMVFVSLGMTTTIDGQEYDVLWATCNLGAKEAIETGFLYAWGEVNRKNDNLYSPTGYTGTASTDIRGTDNDPVKNYLGDGHWLWCTPSKDMWYDIIIHCTWTWKTVKKVTEGEATEDNLDFDASVWEVTKKDDNNNLVGRLYFPITGYSGKDESTEEYKKVTKAKCRYWTSTPCSSTAGATEKSYAFVTDYSIEGSEGHMSTYLDAMKEQERYQGFAIRPVLLKEKK